MNGENADGVEREHHVRYEVEWGFRGGMMGSNSDFGSDSFCAKTAAGGHQRAFTGLSGGHQRNRYHNYNTTAVLGDGFPTVQGMHESRYSTCCMPVQVLVVFRYKYLFVFRITASALNESTGSV